MCGVVSGLREGGGYLSSNNGRIAYTVNNGNDSDIYTIKPEGGGKFKVTDTATDDYSPSWGAVSRGSPLLL